MYSRKEREREEESSKTTSEKKKEEKNTRSSLEAPGYVEFNFLFQKESTVITITLLNR
jgi:hypothetical protein